jgi:hypothetical protein
MSDKHPEFYFETGRLSGLNIEQKMLPSWPALRAFSQ